MIRKLRHGQTRGSNKSVNDAKHHKLNENIVKFKNFAEIVGEFLNSVEIGDTQCAPLA